jgi:hypothetical protein
LGLSERNRQLLRRQSAQTEARLETDITEALSVIVATGELPTPLKIEAALDLSVHLIDLDSSIAGHLGVYCAAS